MILLIFLFILLYKTIYIFISKIFNDINRLFYKFLYGLCETPKTQYDFLEQNLKNGFKTSWSNPGIYYGRDTALAPYIDNILFFGSNNEKNYTQFFWYILF